MDVHLSLNSESELGENYSFCFTFPWFWTKDIDTNKQNMVTYVDNHVLVHKDVYMYLSKTNSENNQTHGHMNK